MLPFWGFELHNFMSVTHCGSTAQICTPSPYRRIKLSVKKLGPNMKHRETWLRSWMSLSLHAVRCNIV